MNIFKKLALKLKLIKPKQNWFKKFFKSFKSLFGLKSRKSRFFVGVFGLLFLITLFVTYVSAQRGFVFFGGSSNQQVEIFTAVGTQTWTVPDGVNYVEVLVVAGGGGGGSSTRSGGGGGGGGAGGVKYASAFSVTEGQNISVTIGEGGAPGGAGLNVSGSNGQNSLFGPLIATGGGGGGSQGVNGQSGGSGGGAGYNGYRTVRYGGSGAAGEGSPGGNTSLLSWAGGAGGGGAGGPGGDNKTSHRGGDGGPGLEYSITGSPVIYSVGGNGGSNSPSPSPANTGKGGDAAYATGTAYAGGSGIVVIKYSISPKIKISTLQSGLIGHWSLDRDDYEPEIINLAPFTDYSNRNYNEQYSASCWGGDVGYIEYFDSGGFNNLPYKKLTKTAGGTGGCYRDDHIDFLIEDNKTYIVSAYLKANKEETVSAHALDLNRASDNRYRVSSNLNLTPQWKRYFWVYKSGNNHAGAYRARQIIYNNDNLPLEVYWSGFQVEEALEMSPYFNGSKTSRVADKTPNNNDGKNYGAIFTEDRFGKEGGAMSFNGYDNVISTNPFKLNNELSVCAWIRPDTLTTKEIIIHGSPSTGAFDFYQSGRGLSLRGGGLSPSVSTSNVLSLNDWGFACANINNNYGEIYYNGELMASGSVASPNSTSEAVHIGAQANSAYAFQGAMDDVRIYNRTLSELEIKSLYDTYNPKTTTGSLQKGLVLDMPLKLKYTKSEISGSQIMTDRTPYSNDAQNYGATITEEGVYFNGSGDHIRLNYSSQYNIREAITLSIWMKRNTGFNQNTDVWLLGRRGSWYFYDEYSSGDIRGEVFIDGARRAARQVPVPFDENWYHIVYTYDSETRTGVIYKNGESYSSVTLSGLSNYLIDLSSSNFMYIGNNYKSRKMTYSNFLIYNRSLSEEEVKTLYDRGRFN